MRFKRLLIAAGLVLAASSAWAQAQFPAGTVWGNATAAQRPGKAETVTSMLDRALGSTRGAILQRGASGWAIFGPGATARVPYLSGGTGADPILGAFSLPASVTSGGIAYFSSATAMASSGAFATTEILRGGGTGNAPVATVCGTANTVLHGGAPPACSQVVYADIASAAIATAANYYTGASSVLVPADQVYPTETTTTYGTTTTFDFNTFINTAVTLTGNITTQTLSNVKAGKAGTITFIQDGGGSKTTVWSTTFKFAGGILPALSTTGGAIDILSYSCRTASFCVAALIKDVRNP